MDPDLIPSTYQLLRVVVPDEIVVQTITARLPADWRSETMISRELGDDWLDRSTSALLQVPSAISERANNFLLNPAHPDAVKISIAEIIKAPFDSRLLT